MGDARAKQLKASRAGIRLAKLWAKLEAAMLHASKLKDKVRKALDRVKDSIAKRRAAAGGGGGGGGGLPEPPKGPGDGRFVVKAAKKDYTLPSGKMGGKPRGARTKTDGGGDKPRGHGRENEAADTLARHGYDVEQNPGRNPYLKNPDYKIEGKYFDCYAPTAKTEPNRIRKGIEAKVKEKQADRVVLNLDDSPKTPDEMKELLAKDPVPGLKEVITIKDGNIQHIFP